MMNVDQADPDLTQVAIPDDFLSKVYLARCALDYKNTCSSPQGEITDFNIWSKALTPDEMKDFTTCR